jgi:hypothetical protein
MNTVVYNRLIEQTLLKIEKLVEGDCVELAWKWTNVLEKLIAIAVNSDGEFAGLVKENRSLDGSRVELERKQYNSAFINLKGTEADTAQFVRHQAKPSQGEEKKYYYVYDDGFLGKENGRR